MELLSEITRVQVYGIILLLAGLVIRYFVNRRRFNRRSITGMQQYKNYEQAVAITYFEKFLKLFGLTLVLFGIFLIAIEIFNKS